MVHFTRYGSAALFHSRVRRARRRARVTPFGHPRIKGCVPLPAASRSLPRPSSPYGSTGIRHRPISRLTILSFRPARPLTAPARSSAKHSAPGTRCPCRILPTLFSVKELLQSAFQAFYIFMERDRVELSTPALSERCSNQLSYHSKTYEERRGEGKRADIACRRHGHSPARTPRRISLSRRKEVIQPHLPVRLPCYDFTPLTGHTLESGPLAVSLPASGIPNSDGVTGGVYKARERIHRAVLMRDY